MSTPARKQYLRIKKEHESEILLFRMGDFYETFDDDAHILSKELDIALTSREMGKGQRFPLAGIPYHSLDSYMAKLIKKGYKLAICEQTSDPATSKGLVNREVVRVITPGTIIEDSILEQNINNFLASIVVDGNDAGLAYIDISTSEFTTSQFPINQLHTELTRISPSEILVSDITKKFITNTKTTITILDAEAFDQNRTKETLLNHFNVTSLEAYGCDHLSLAIASAGSILDYLNLKQKIFVPHINSLSTYSTSSYMALDSQTRRNLELYESGRWNSSNASLLSVLDFTKTPMGGRLFKRWISQPLLDLKQIIQRQEGVSWFHNNALRRERIISILRTIQDIERLTNRIRSFTANPRDLISLSLSLEAVPKLTTILSLDKDTSLIKHFTDEIQDNNTINNFIKSAISEDPPTSINSGGILKTGFSNEIDNLRNQLHDAQEYIIGLEKRERERTGIKSLKIGYNKVFGYYIEVSNPNLSLVPDDFIRRQTLVGAERFITPEMKHYESIVLNTQDSITDLESTLFREICQQVGDDAHKIMATAQAIAQIDVLTSLAEAASKYDYVKPKLTEGNILEIKNGRHPVVERKLPVGSFVSNETKMSNEHDQLIILTGPNMSGKSTYIRQVAIMVLMAQIGSFVPAESASIGIVDRIFTRVGLQDDLATGQSTFMVEMLETAAIINHATQRSLIILDEIGRGTSTYDGLSIARAVAEHIHNHPKLGCKTLFATHYHELTQLANSLPRVKNYNVAVSENLNKIVFLRRIIPGGANKSYGVHVAKLAGLPTSIINRAWEVLDELETNNINHENVNDSTNKISATYTERQITSGLNFSSIIKEILQLDIGSMTPIEAINKLDELQEKIRDNEM